MTDQYRKRMRGIAVFFMTISTLGFLLSLTLWGGDPSAAISGSTLFSIGQWMLIFIFAAMMWHGSRLGAVLLMLVILASISIAASSKPSTDYFRISLFTCFAVIAAFGCWHTFKYHRESLIDDLPIRGWPAIRWGGLMVMLLPLGLASTGYGMQRSNISSAVLPAYEIDAQHYQWMAEKDFLLVDERVQYFYSGGVFSISEDGNLLTNRYVGSWWQTDEGELTSYWLPIGEVCRVEAVKDEATRHIGVYNIYGAGDGNWVKIWLSTEQNGDQAFLSRLAYLNKRKQHDFVKDACEQGIAIDRDGLALANGIEQSIVSADLVEPDQRQWLSEQGYLTPDETILAFYSYGTYGIELGGSMLTDQYFGGWYRKDGQAFSAWAKIGEICTIEQVIEGDLEADEDAEYKITYDKDSWYKARLSTRGDQDAAVIETLRKRNAAAKSDDTHEACKSWGETDTEDV